MNSKEDRIKKNHKDFYEYDEIEDYIGQGGYATVYKAKLKGTNEVRAIKVIKLYQIKREIQGLKNETIQTYIDGFHNEIEYMKMMEGKNNKNTVKYYEHFEDQNLFVIVMELCDCNLEDLKNIKENNNEHFNSDEIYYILSQLNNSFKIMVDNQIVHRDLSLRSILIKYENEEKTKYIVKLSDYGISKQMSELTLEETTIRADFYNFMAPEINLIGKFDLKADLWSLGIIIYILFFNKNPFTGESTSAILNQIKNKREFKKTMDPDLDSLLKRLLVENIDERISWEEYFNHPFFKNKQLINDIIYETPNQIVIKLKIGKKDVSKEVCFLDNEYYLDNNIRKKFDDYNKEIKELNEEKVEIFINDINDKNNKNKMNKFNKCFTPAKEGEYEITIIFKSKIKDCRYMFRNCNNIISIDLSSFDSTGVNNMHYMFGKCHNLKEVDIGNLVGDNVTDMSYLFNKCFSLEKVKFPSSFNTKNVKKMSFMFNCCHNLSEIRFSNNFKTNNVTTMRAMFKKCYNLKSINLTNFTFENLSDMGYMFDECINLENILLNNEFKTPQVTNMTYLFNNCQNLKEINLSSFNSENIKYLNYMFSGCLQLKNIDLSSFKVKETVNMTYMFNNCSSLENLEIPHFKIANNSDKINNMFDNLTNIKKIKVNNDCIDNFKESFKDIKEKFSTK